MTGPITVVIATRDRPGDLRRCLDGLAHTDTALLAEVVVIDDASSQPVVLRPRDDGVPVRLMRSPARRGADRVRNLASETVRSPYLAFLDDDAVPRHDWLTVIAAGLQEDLAVTGRVLRFDAGLVSRARQARYDGRYAPLAADAPVSFFAGGNGAVRTGAFRAAGGFTARAAGGDNSLVAEVAAQGGSVRFRPDMVIAHRNSKGFTTAARAAYQAGRGVPARRTVADLRALTHVAPDGRWDERVVNTVLGHCHTLGRLSGRHRGGA